MGCHQALPVDVHISKYNGAAYLRTSSSGAANTRMQLHFRARLQAPSGEATSIVFGSNLGLVGAGDTRMQLLLLVWLQAPSGEERPRAFDNNLTSARAANTSMQVLLLAWLQAPSGVGKARRI